MTPQSLVCINVCLCTNHAAIHSESVEKIMDTTIESALKHLKACAAAGQPLPAAIEKAEWSTQAQLKTVVVDHYRALDANMNADRLAEGDSLSHVVSWRLLHASLPPCRPPRSQPPTPRWTLLCKTR